MHNESFFLNAFVYLTAAVIAVPIAKRLGLGSVLGYLIAGIAIGPYVLGLVGEEGEDVMHFAEFGVVIMLFVVGLELRPSLLWKLKTPILGSGGSQVLVTTAVITGIAMAFGLIWQEALAIGLTLALSSTAIVLQTLNEKGLMKSAAGQRSFSVLLFQDIAVIPMLALMPLLATHDLHHGGHGHEGHHEATTWVAGLAPWAQALATLGSVLVVIILGRFVMGHVFRIIASTGLREIFTAAALLLVIGIALLMTKVGLSAALGTFLAGVVLSESEYRHELESDIDPFKGLLLGLFFIAVGAGIDFNLIADKPLLIASLVGLLMLVKFVVLSGIAKATKMSLDQGSLFALALAQGGEFGFVLFSFATQNGILGDDTTKPLIAAVALSMALTPLLFIIHERLILPNVGTKETEDREADDMDEDAPVIIAGFGRYGNVVGRFLRASGVETTVLEHDSDHVDLLRKLGLKVFYGDASRHDLLHAAGAESAKLFILAIDEEEKAMSIVETCQKHFPNLKILARATSRAHAAQLIRAGVHDVFLEQQASALNLGINAMCHLGHRRHAATRAAAQFANHDTESLRVMAETVTDEKSLIRYGRQHIQDLEERMKMDQEELEGHDGRAWDNSSLRDGF